MSSCPFDVGIWRCSSAIGTLRPNPVELETEISGMVGSVTLVLTGPRIYRNSVRSLPDRGGPKWRWCISLRDTSVSRNMTGQNCDVLRYNVGASAAFLLAMAKVLRSVISEVRSGSNAKRFKSVATEISKIFCRDFAWGSLPDGTFCRQERNMLHYITTL